MTNLDSSALKGRRLLIMLILAALAVAMLYAVFRFASNSGAGPDGQGGVKVERYAKGSLQALRLGEKMLKQPSQTFVGADGGRTSLAAFRGKVVLLNLWATWCTPCIAEMPTLAALAENMQGPDFEVVAISLDAPEKTQEAKAFIAKLSEDKFKYYQDDTARMAFAIQAPGLPVSVLYDRRGTEIARLAGAAEWSSPEAKALIAAAIAAR